MHNVGKTFCTFSSFRRFLKEEPFFCARVIRLGGQFRTAHRFVLTITMNIIMYGGSKAKAQLGHMFILKIAQQAKT